MTWHMLSAVTMLSTFAADLHRVAITHQLGSSFVGIERYMSPVMMSVPTNNLYNADLTLLTKKLLPVHGSVMAELTSGQGSNAVYQDQFDAVINDTGLQSLHHNATLPSNSAEQAFQNPL